jgi:hypothetical protein
MKKLLEVFDALLFALEINIDEVTDLKLEVLKMHIAPAIISYVNYSAQNCSKMKAYKMLYLFEVLDNGFLHFVFHVPTNVKDVQCDHIEVTIYLY